ncbi:aldose epimerase family protein [Alkaliphilus peptidifermentans]|uniref:Aldose 1-epimerase n=1 Tax=Alkaliphilus peptidifermentans DSM 18978 TaxID=1120976 RepID=A0A1G5I1Y7_9FIRM|nr:aldose epimerase family protein [Alkaliphilus peptidifermentans]SCY70037.1 aldose 1-epimerase [Alkaliphilus peptidifermentans DSM 18978]
MKSEKTLVGRTKKNQDIFKYSLENDNGFTISILNIGATIYEILAPDRDGKYENIVLSYGEISDYEENPDSIGCVIGRTAGRISKGEFLLDGEKYYLAKNDGNNNIHGGVKGFGRVIWEATERVDKESISLILNYNSPHMEEGFPGNLKVTVTYELNNKNELKLSYRGISDRMTVVNLTNHSYFNLSGEVKRDILDHHLSINADTVAVINKEILPTGEIRDVKGTVFDFRTSKKVGKDINDNELRSYGGYDHPFILNPSTKPTILLEDQESGRYMEIETDQPTVIFYTGNHLNKEIRINGGMIARRHSGLCLETQDYPDAPNQCNFPSSIINEDKEYLANTIYRFGILT